MPVWAHQKAQVHSQLKELAYENLESLAIFKALIRRENKYKLSPYAANINIEKNG